MKDDNKIIQSAKSLAELNDILRAIAHVDECKPCGLLFSELMESLNGR